MMKWISIVMLSLPLQLFSQNDSIDLVIKASQVKIPFFQFLLNKNGTVLYNYDSTHLERNLLEISNPTKENLVAAINSIEKRYQIHLAEDQIIIRGDADLKYEQLMFLKGALKEKHLFKYRFITTGNSEQNHLKRNEKERDVSLISGSPNTLILILAANNQIFYYHGGSCKKLFKTDFKEVKEVLKVEKRNTKIKDLFILIKVTEQSTFKNAIDLLDEIVLSKIPAGHYAEENITSEEINCVKNYKNQ